MKVFLRQIPKNPSEYELCDITKYVKKINLNIKKLNSGSNEIELNNFSVEVINHNAKFSEIKKGDFFPEGNAYNIPIYIVDEKTMTIIDSGIINNITEYLNRNICVLNICSPLSILSKNIECSYTGITPPEVILRILEKLEIQKSYINFSSFDKAINYYENNNISINVTLTNENKKNGFNIINEILAMTGDSVFTHNNVIEYYLNKEYSGEGGFNIDEKELSGPVKIYRDISDNVITRVKYKLSSSTSYEYELEQDYENLNYIKKTYKTNEHYKDYSTDKIKLLTGLQGFNQIGKNLLLKKGERTISAEFHLDLKYSFLKIGQIINLNISNRNIFAKPFEIISRGIDYKTNKIKILCKDLNIFPEIPLSLDFIPPKKIQGFHAQCFGTCVKLYWFQVTENVNNEPINNLSGYKIYYGKFSGNYDSTYINYIGNSPVIVQENVNYLEIWNCPKNALLFFSVTAFTNADSESIFSKEISIYTGNSGYGITPFGSTFGA